MNPAAAPTRTLYVTAERFAIVLSLTGIAAHLTGALAQAGVNVNVITTFDTDYILVQEEKLTTALKALQEARYEIIKNG